MSKINELHEELLAIEDKAGEVEPTDYEALYKLLAPAYFIAKDIIELSSGANPVAQEPVDDTELVAANEAIKEHKIVILELQTKLNQILKIIT